MQFLPGDRLHKPDVLIGGGYRDRTGGKSGDYIFLVAYKSSGDDRFPNLFAQYFYYFGHQAGEDLNQIGAVVLIRLSDIFEREGIQYEETLYRQQVLRSGVTDKGRLGGYYPIDQRITDKEIHGCFACRKSVKQVYMGKNALAGFLKPHHDIRYCVDASVEDKYDFAVAEKGAVKPLIVFDGRNHRGVFQHPDQISVFDHPPHNPLIGRYTYILTDFTANCNAKSNRCLLLFEDKTG